jgi:hypothetical protein
LIGEWSYLVVTLSRAGERAREAKLYLEFVTWRVERTHHEYPRCESVKCIFRIRLWSQPVVTSVKMEEEASGVKLHLGVSVIATWSIETLHHRNHDMRDRDEIWTVGSLEISTVDQAR